MSRFLKLEQNSPEWLAWRGGHIGASEAAIILGKSPWSTPYGLWLQKTGRAQGDVAGLMAERGHEIEPVARAAYEIEAGFVVMEPVCVKHPVHEQIGCSLDGISEDYSRILEIKYPSDKSFAEIRTGGVPDHYWIQIQHQLACTPEAKDCHFYAYRKDGSVLLTVIPDQEFQKELIEAELAFWDLVQSNTAPPLTDKDAKHVEGDEWEFLRDKILSAKNAGAKKELDLLKMQAIEMGEHNKVRFKDILISKTANSYRLTVSRQGDVA